MKKHLYDGDTFEHEGHTFKVKFEDDQDMGPPWEAHDGHGVVSDWTHRDKRPGEVVLVSDRHLRRYYDIAETNRIAKRDGWGLGEEAKVELLERLARPRTLCRPRKGQKPKMTQTGFISRRYTYTNDQFETVEIPGRDPNKPLTPGEIRAEAVRRDFEYLRQWCNDQWNWLYVKVTLLREDDDGELVEDESYTDAVGGVESFNDYHVQFAYECADNIIAQLERARVEAEKEEIERRYWAERDTITIV